MRTDFQFLCDPPHALLRLDGELDLATRADLSDAIECLRSRGCTQVAVNAHTVSFIDASCLGALAREQHRCREDGGELTVVAASRRYQLVARLTGYEDLLPVRRGVTSSYVVVR